MSYILKVHFYMLLLDSIILYVQWQITYKGPKVLMFGKCIDEKKKVHSPVHPANVCTDSWRKSLGIKFFEIKNINTNSISVWVLTIQKALIYSCAHKFQRDLYLLVEKSCQAEKKMSSRLQEVLLEWYLYDVLLDDLPLWNGDVLWGALLAAQPCEGAAPGQRERAAESQLHGLPTRHLPPLPRLPLQTLDSLQKTQQGGSEVKGAEPERTGGLLLSTCTITHRHKG